MFILFLKKQQQKYHPKPNQSTQKLCKSRTLIKKYFGSPTFPASAKKYVLLSLQQMLKPNQPVPPFWGGALDSNTSFG